MVRCIKFCYWAYTTFTFDKSFPERLNIISKRRNRTHSSYYNTSTHITLLYSHMHIPPSTLITCPVMYEALGDARKAIASAISSGRPYLFNRIVLRNGDLIEAFSTAVRSV